MPEIVCLHIYELPEYATRQAFRTLVQEDEEKKMQDFVRPYHEQGYGPLTPVLLEKEFITRTGIYIHEYALAHNTDLIVIGAKGLSPLERMNMGSVTERLLSVNDHVPTLIIK
jgi:nucleotide-binding universal stress UspA family protein